MSLAIPKHLSGTQAQGVIPGQTIAQFEIGAAQNFVYALIDWAEGQAVIVDPHLGSSQITQALAAHDLNLEAVWLTHSHWDHINGINEIARSPGLARRLPVQVHPLETRRIRRQTPFETAASLVDLERVEFIALEDSSALELGLIKAHVLHTPGHTAGACSFFIEPVHRGDPAYVLSGDTLFIRDCGRTDLPTGSDEEMFYSLDRLKRLRPETILLPGHHYKAECASTIGQELQANAALRAISPAELRALP